jgi:DNA ligase-1
MLAAKIGRGDLERLHYPLIVQPKYDGIRCLVTEEGAMSRKLKHIPNSYIQNLLCSSRKLIGLDGELIAGETYNKTSSAVMSRDGIPEFTYYVFDLWNEDVPYTERIIKVGMILMDTKFFCIKISPASVAHNADEVLKAFAELDELRCDGVILRDPQGMYKFGRSTVRQQWLMKYKVFDDAEAEVIAVEEMMHNDNEAERDALGYTKRSSHKEGKTPSGILGALVVADVKSGTVFRIGTGFTQQDRFFLWKERASLIGRTVSYKYQGGGGYEAPRFPTFRGFRDDV